MGEIYLPAFVLAIGMSETLSGLFASLPFIFGAFIQLFTIQILRYLKTAKWWVVASSFFQGFIYLIFTGIALKYSNSQLLSGASEGPPSVLLVLFLFILAAFYWGAGFGAGSAWNYWMSQIIPSRIVSRYFPRRMRTLQIGVLIGIILGGYVLHHKWTLWFLSPFAVLFFTAFCSRTISSVLLIFQSKEKNYFSEETSLPLRKVFHYIQARKNYRDFFIFLFIFNFSVSISAPFVAPFFLMKLKLSYDQFMGATGILILAKILVLPLAEKLIVRWGVRKVLIWGALGVSPLPGLWFLSQDFLFVLVLQTFSGAFWSLFEVGVSIVLFQDLKAHEKIPIITFYNFFNAMALILGALLGGQILHLMGESFVAYYVIFAFGSFLRCFTSYYYFAKADYR